MLKHSLREILYLPINILDAVFDILCHFWTTDKAWLQSQQVSKYFDGTVQLGGLLHLHVLYWHSFLMVVQKDIRLDHHGNSSSPLSLYEVLRYKCENVPIKMWIIDLEDKAFGKRPLVQTPHGSSRLHLHPMSCLFTYYHVLEFQSFCRSGQYSCCLF